MMTDEDLWSSISLHLNRRVALGQRLAGSQAFEAEASGTTITLSDGRRFLDLGTHPTGVLGHSPPDVISAVTMALSQVSSTSRVLANPYVARLSQRLVDALEPDRLRRVYFGLNGCDAVEAALKLARVATGRSRILAVSGAFHGKSLGALSVTYHGEYRWGLEDVLTHVTFISPEDGQAVARECDAGDVAAIIFEPIQGENGVRPLPGATLREWADAAHAAGAFVIADEIQTGFWRCGHPALSLAWGLEPDAVLLGKALGGGVMPLSAVVASDDLYAPLQRNVSFHTATFSEHPLSCAAGLAAIDSLTARSDEIWAVSHQLAERLDRLAEEGRSVEAVRQCALLGAIEFASPRIARRVFYGCIRDGLLLSPCTTAPKVLRILPNLTTTPTELDAAFQSIRRSLARAVPA